MKRFVKTECDNCGSTEISFNEKKGLYICDYCRSEFQVDDRGEKALKVVKGIGIGYAVYAGIIILIVAGVFLSVFFIFNNFNKSFDKTSNTIKNEFENQINNMDTTEKHSPIVENPDFFNAVYELYSGTSYTVHVEDLIEEVVTNNKKNKEQLITLIYKDNSTSNPEELVKIKHSLKSNTKYEVSLDYNEKGYVYKITIYET